MALLARFGFIEPGTDVLDYGCGQGDDVRVLTESGVVAIGWDPHFRPDTVRQSSSVVNLGFVLNVIERPAERAETLRSAWSFCSCVLAVAVMVTGHRPTVGLRMLRLAIDTHPITAHHALPLLIERPGGLLVEVTDGTAEYNADHYRASVFYDLCKTAVTRIAWAHAKDLAPSGTTAVSITPGWMRSEIMLETFGVTEANWRDATAKEPHFVISETQRFVGRAVAALAADPDRHRWTGQSLSSGRLAQVYGFKDLDGSQPDCWRYMREVQDAGRPADATGYR
jgi:NAD(P)-dependent dehydrogenase (short-subunit alcohol dehydrogenase family)